VAVNSQENGESAHEKSTTYEQLYFHAAWCTGGKCRLLLNLVAVEKVQFSPKPPKSGGYKMSGKLRKSFVGHPGAIFFDQF
jgi:hypothetical protein